MQGIAGRGPQFPCSRYSQGAEHRDATGRLSELGTGDFGVLACWFWFGFLVFFVSSCVLCMLWRRRDGEKGAV